MKHHALRLFIGLALCLMMYSTASAQIAVGLKPTKKTYLSGEPILMELTIINQTGRAIELKNRGNMPWLDITISKTDNNDLLPQIQFANFPATTLPAGRQIARKIDMQTLYDLKRTGSYYASAFVRSPDGRNLYTSSKIFFSVQMGGKLWSQSFATQDGKRYAYNIRLLPEQGKLLIYAQVCTSDGETPLYSVSLGESLAARLPVCRMDSNQNVHVLFPCTPVYYSYGCVNKDGKRLQFAHYRTIPGIQPNLISLPNGQVQVNGAVYYNPSIKTPKVKDAAAIPK